VLKAQDATLHELGHRPLVNIASDGARVRARRALERLIDAEHGGNAPAVSRLIP